MAMEETLENLEEQPKKKGRWKRVVLIVVCVILALLLISVACISAYVNHLLGQMNYVEPGAEETIPPAAQESLDLQDPEMETIDPSSTESLPSLEDVTFPSEPEVTDPPPKEEEPEPEANYINILLIGQDRRPGQGRQRSDAMILATFHLDAKTVTLTSFMRDQYVQIPGYKPNKLNAAYQYGGMSLLNETLRVNFGVRVDGDIEVDFGQFENIIDLLGGVDIKLTEAEVNTMNHATNWGLIRGTNRLNGEQALVYSRIRYIDSDYRRAERQRKVLLSLIERYKSLPVTEMLGILEDVLPMVTTNMTKDEIVGLVWDVFPILASAQFNSLRIPVDGSFDQGTVKVRDGLKNWFQYNIDFDENRQLLKDLFRTGKP